MSINQEIEARRLLSEAEFALSRTVGIFRREGGAPPPPEASEALALVRDAIRAVPARIRVRDNCWEVSR